MLVLANWRAIEKLGKPITSFHVEGFEAGFAIPEINEFKEKTKKREEKCIMPNEEKRCLEYKCSEPVVIPDEYARIIDEVYEETKSLDDVSLNRLVIRDPRYRDLLERGGFLEG